MKPMTQQDATLTVNELLAPYAARCEEDLDRLLVEPDTPEALAEAMRYCVLGAGKRLRPALVHMAAEAAGGGPEDLVARAAAAVELVHCYSMVHDDLPAMDDDTLRRGRPTAHARFGEAMAILVGDALLTRAFGILAGAGHPRSARLGAELAAGAGPAGMIAGQVADMALCKVPDGFEGTRFIHLRKTAALFRAAARMGAVCADASGAVIEAMGGYADYFGLTYQVRDDLLDVTGDAGIIGKTPGKDADAGKPTAASRLGLDGARKLGEELTEQAVAALPPLGATTETLARLARLLTHRIH